MAFIREYVEIIISNLFWYKIIPPLERHDSM